ncbi:hypothetical protein NDU88_006455 [Pleurodeles waltl]|uniref:Uncharacterized protein n=1 Tax=Pleurodeles waltl TaxID=8319 RepID=A0AAV7NQ94_PLEWA|nr:hypothetical protein NDU88_006455 [Pleurodeles waltl]
MAPRVSEPGVVTPQQLGPEMRLRGGGDPVLPSTRSGRGGQPAGSPAAGSGTQKIAHWPPQYRWLSGSFPRAGAGDNSSSEAGARDEAPGERRRGPASVSPSGKGQPTGGTRDAEKCPRLPQCKGSPTAGTGEAPKTWTPIDPRSWRAGLQGIHQPPKTLSESEGRGQ